MNIDSDYIDLFFEPSDAIAALVRELSEDDWLVNCYRQNTYPVHRQTNSVVYVWSEHDYNRIESHIKPGYNELSERVYSIAERMRQNWGSGAVITKLMLARPGPGQQIPEHKDGHLLTLIHRCHYVVETNPGCVFTINGVDYRFTEGRAVEINNQAAHSVKNLGPTARVHLICDILPRAGFKNT